MGIFAQALISGEDIKNYIPQREPIIMLDAFYGIDGNQSFSGLTIQADTIFVENNRFNEAGLIEHIAQSCAARIGYYCRQQNEKVPVGYIGALKKMQIFDLPQVGQQLQTTVTIEQEIFDITLVSAEIKVNQKTIAVCEMKIFLDKNS
jgi:predicted hotdog family 3-hydroxylacyl-ACP dehydratase